MQSLKITQKIQAIGMVLQFKISVENPNKKVSEEVLASSVKNLLSQFIVIL